MKELAARSKNPAAWVLESDERSSDSGNSLRIWSPACEAESVDARPLANLGAGDDAIFHS